MVQDMSMSVFVSWCGDRETKSNPFSPQQYGEVESVKIMTTVDKGSGMARSRGFGFVLFVDVGTLETVGC